jgi:serpin B
MLKALGMPLAYDVARADFTGMTDPASGKDSLVLSTVVHQASVSVDEEGTVATAATAAIMMERGVPDPPLVFTADHPFLFLIVDRANSVVLFLGRVVEPTASSSP